MNASIITNNKLATTLGVIVIGLCSVFAIQKGTINDLNNELNKQKLKSEALLSENLAKQKDLEKNKAELVKLGIAKRHLSDLLNETDAKLKEKEQQLLAINQDAGKSKKVEKELAKIRESKNALEKQMEGLNREIANINEQNNSLKQSNTRYAAANDKLTKDLNVLSAIMANDYRVESLKGKKDHLTVSARRTKKLLIGFNIPQNIASNIDFKIVRPDGTVIDDKKDGISYEIVENGEGLMASITPTADGFDVTKRIEMTYRPKDRLKGGVYTIQIYNSGSKLTSCQIRLK